MRNIKKEIFKEYDIRGKYPQEINEKNIYLITKAFIFFLEDKSSLNKKRIVLGRDDRTSSLRLKRAAIKALLECGVEIMDLDKISTPEINFACSFLRADGGIMITASHNPKSYNGLKLMKKNSQPIGGKELLEIYKKIFSGGGIKKRRKIINGSLIKVDIKENYLEANLGKEKKNPKINASFDKDRDRVFIKDELGRKIRPDIIGGIIANAIAQKGDIVLYDLRCTKAIPEFLKNRGVITIPCRVGHYNIKKEMSKRRAVFGMEITGHYYFKKFNNCEAPLFALKILEDYKNKTGKKLYELAKPFSKYFHSGVIDIKISKIKSSPTELFKKLKEKYKNGSQNEMDGLTVEFSNWWFNIRISHTEPLLKLVVEAKREEVLEEKRGEILNYLNFK